MERYWWFSLAFKYWIYH